MPGQDEREGEARHGHARKPCPARGGPAHQEEQPGKQQVELLFHPQRPAVDEGLQRDRDVPIAGRRREQQIVRKQRRRDHRLAEIFKLVGEHQKPAAKSAERHHQIEHRHDPPHTAFVEAPERHIPAAAVFDQERSDQIAADDEEDVHAQEAAGEQALAGVEENDGNDRDRAQTVDLTTMFQPLSLRKGAAPPAALAATIASAALRQQSGCEFVNSCKIDQSYDLWSFPR